MFLFPSMKKTLAQEPKPLKAFSLNCPECGHSLYSTKEGHECLSCGKRYSADKLLAAYSVCAADCARLKTTAKFHAMSMNRLNNFSEFNLKRARSLEAENQQLQAALQAPQAEIDQLWDALESQSDYFLKLLKKLDDRMAALERQLSHN